MKRLVWSAIAVSLTAASGLHAEDSTTTVLSNFNAPLNDVKAKIFDTNLATKAMGNGAKLFRAARSRPQSGGIPPIAGKSCQGIDL
jgi:hypothetical protein